MSKSKSTKSKVTDVFTNVSKSSSERYSQHPISGDNQSKNQQAPLETELSAAPMPPQEEEITVVSSSSFGAASTSSASSISTTSLPCSDLNLESPSQPRLKSYPKTTYPHGTNKTCERSFSSSWYSGRPWLEYSVEKDSCFCFPCRVFGCNMKSNNYTEVGYSNWKSTLDNQKGFVKHTKASQHINNMAAWVDKQHREKAGETINNAVHCLEKDHEKWLQVIYNVVRYLSANGLPFRGDDECLDIDAQLSGGLFLNTLQDLVFEMKPDIKSLAKKMPRNAKYLSSDIQNEIIQVLADMVRDKHAVKIRKSELYTIMVDGTTDKNHEEIQGVVIRFFNLETFGIEERALNVGKSGRSADDIFDFVKETLDDAKISFDGMVSQAFDGANVMSGRHGGLQALISTFCGRNVVYIHCYCHRLQLAVKAVMDNIDEIKYYFSEVSALYNFFKLAPICEEYSGGKLKRLIETRWSGHLLSSKAIQDNYDELEDTLKSAMKNKKLKGEYGGRAIGLHIQITCDEFIFLTHFIVDILSNCNITNKILQSSRENLSSAMASISSIREDLLVKRDEYDDGKIRKIIDEVRGTKQNTAESRSTTIPQYLRDYLITEAIPIREDVNLHRLAVESLDLIEEEFSHRFAKENTDVWGSMACLLPSSTHFMDVGQLQPFYNYSTSIPAVRNKFIAESLSKCDFEEECCIFKRILSKEDPSIFEHETRKTVDMNKVCAFMVRNHANSAPVLTTLYKVAVTAGYASARLECLFSALAKIDSPQTSNDDAKRSKSHISPL